MEKIKELIKKVLTKEVILYIVFGLLTTAVNLVSFWLMNSKLNWNEDLSNGLAIVLAIIVAYFTNKDLVFHSGANGFREKLFEFFKFVLGRAFTMALEFGGGLIFLSEDNKTQNLIVKLLLTIIVIILNFFISKFFAFKKKENKENKEDNKEKEKNKDNDKDN